MKNTTRMINLLIITALLGSASNMNALSRPSAPQEKKAVTSEAAATKEAAKPGRIKRMRNWMGREIFNRQKLGRNAKYGAGMAALIYALMVATARMRRDSLRANTAWAPTRAAGWVADNTLGRVQRALIDKGVLGDSWRHDPFSYHRNRVHRTLHEFRQDNTHEHARQLTRITLPDSIEIVEREHERLEHERHRQPKYDIVDVAAGAKPAFQAYSPPTGEAVVDIVSPLSHSDPRPRPGVEDVPYSSDGKPGMRASMASSGNAGAVNLK